MTRVHKRRAHYTIDDCMVERTELTADDHAICTIAIESPDPELVLATRRRLGLDGRPNVNVARGLKTLIGFGSQRYAVIDVGTNSVKFHIGERRADGSWQTIVDRAEVTRLGEGLDESGRLTRPRSSGRWTRSPRWSSEARQSGVVEIAAVGTAGLRIAPNRATLTDAVQARCGVIVEIISGEEEGSTRVRRRDRLAPHERRSARRLRLGRRQLAVHVRPRRDTSKNDSASTSARCVSPRRYGLTGIVSDDELDAALDAIAADLDRLDGRKPPDAVVAIGGTVTNLAAVKHGLVAVRPRHRARHGARHHRDRSSDRALSHPRPRSPASDRRPSTRPSGGHPRGSVHRAHDPDEAREATLSP